tara:strand:- start:3782 stop:4603 length:822 start_codon:yes stop_codon:yes gene_type:complete
MTDNIPKFVFIIPYRDREKEKLHFSIYMKYIMEDIPDKDYEIYFSHQPLGLPFNRGATKNIGFLAIKNKYPNNYKNITFVFNDIDTMPSKKNLLNYNTTKGTVKHFYGFKFALGGIFSIIGEDFEKCNGFPNIWGWGIEDNEMNKRVINKQLHIDRNQFYPINHKNIIHLYDSPNRLIQNSSPDDYNKNLLIDNLNSINNLEYEILNNSEKTNNFKKTNEFIINISKFKTLKTPNNNEFYTQNIYKNNKIETNQLEKMNARNMFDMNRFMNKK